MQQMLTQADIDFAWAAGLFEGEGHIAHRVYHTRRPHETIRALVLNMTDEDIVKRFHAIVGAGSVRFVKRQKVGWNDIWSWKCTAWVDLEPLLERLLPYLGERRAQKARELLQDPAKAIGRPLADFCLRGHPLSGDNLYVGPTSGPGRVRRACRECRRANLRESRKRKREQVH